MFYTQIRWFNKNPDAVMKKQTKHKTALVLECTPYLIPVLIMLYNAKRIKEKNWKLCRAVVLGV